MIKFGNKLKFVRYGGLSSVRQRGYGSEPSFHVPPARRGIYAFVWPLIETFLLGGHFDHRRMQWVRDSNGEVIAEGHPDFEELMWKYSCYSRKGVFTLVKHCRPKVFEYDGDLWHHLKVPRHNILAEHGDWVLTDIKSYRKSLCKEVGDIDLERRRNGWGTSKDHLEVFIEKV